MTAAGGAAPQPQPQRKPGARLPLPPSSPAAFSSPCPATPVPLQVKLTYEQRKDKLKAKLSELAAADDE